MALITVFSSLSSLWGAATRSRRPFLSFYFRWRLFFSLSNPFFIVIIPNDFSLSFLLLLLLFVVVAAVVLFVVVVVVVVVVCVCFSPERAELRKCLCC